MVGNIIINQTVRSHTRERIKQLNAEPACKRNKSCLGTPPSPEAAQRTYIAILVSKLACNLTFHQNIMYDYTCA